MDKGHFQISFSKSLVTFFQNVLTVIYVAASSRPNCSISPLCEHPSPSVKLTISRADPERLILEKPISSDQTWATVPPLQSRSSSAFGCFQSVIIYIA